MRNSLGIMLLFYYLIASQIAFAFMHDPTKPQEFIQESNSWNLTAILYSSKRKIAVIGGEYLHIGDTVNGATITAITPNSIKLNGPDGQTTLFLTDTSMKQSISKWR